MKLCIYKIITRRSPVDALGLIGQLLDRITAGQRPKKLEEKKLDPYRPLDDVYDLQRDISVNFKLL